MRTRSAPWTADPGFRNQIERLAAAVKKGFGAYLHSRSRIDEINRLEAKSDAELAAMGLTRDRIPHHVFRDLFHR